MVFNADYPSSTPPFTKQVKIHQGCLEEIAAMFGMIVTFKASSQVAKYLPWYLLAVKKCGGAIRVLNWES